MNLSTTYLGLKLRTPLVPSASPLTENLDNLKRLEDAGASAVVFHSLFEEQVRAERLELDQHFTRGTHSYAESLTYFPAKEDFAVGTELYATHIRRAKESLGIPVIASLNGSTFGGWTTFSRQIEAAGADAMELNFYAVPTDADRSAEDIEQELLTIVSAVKAQVKIPVAIKLSPFFTNLTHFVRRLERHGADGLVLFNRFYQPDIDLELGEILPQAQLSTSSALRLPLRWVALLHRRVEMSLAATGGVHRGTDALKLLMAGADVTMMCSALLRHGIDHLRTVECEMAEWMEKHQFESVEQLKGRLSQRNCPNPTAFERAQYIRAVGAFHL